MLLAILIISLLVYAWSLFSKYQSSNDELANIEDATRFNEQFTNYDREDVQGYELLSLVNKVIDYNYRKSNDAAAKSDDKYRPVTVVITLGNEKSQAALSQDGIIRLFTKLIYTQSDTINTFGKIIQEMTDVETKYGGADCATRLAKGIDSIFLSTQQLEQNSKLGFSEEESWQNAIKKFNSYSSGFTIPANDKTTLNGQKENIYKYYEYLQFKRGIFKSDSSKIQYDSTTGRITNMKFDFTGKIY